MSQAPKLTPFWFQPSKDDPAEFHLRPLTTPQFMEALDAYRQEGESLVPTNKAYLIAARYGVIGCRNLIGPDGRKATWPSALEWIDHGLVQVLGLRLLVAARGGKWEDEPDEPHEEGGAAKTAEHEGLEKNSE